jgi:hypothetical protein
MTQYQRKAEHIHEVLGPYASGYFIQETNKLRIGSIRAPIKHSFRHAEVFDQILGAYRYLASS